MLDLNVDATGEDDFAISAAGDELGCNASVFTLNFSVLGKDVVHIDDDVDNEGNMDDSLKGELQLFPMGPLSPSVTAQYWLNLSTGPELSTHLPFSSHQVWQPQVKKSRRGPRSRSSQYRGVTFYRRTGRWESHIWDCGKQVYLGGFDSAHDAARTYDRAAIMFRGVGADINFSTGDYEEDMKQMKNFTKEEFIHLLRHKSTGFPRGNSKYRRSSSLPKHNQRRSLEQKAYEKKAIQVTSLFPGNYMRVVDFSHRDEGRHRNLGSMDSCDTFKRNGEQPNFSPIKISSAGGGSSLGISMSSNSSQGHGLAAAKALRFPSSAMPGNQSLQEKSAATKTSGEADYSVGTWKIQGQGVVPLQAVPILPSAASSGFAHKESPCLSSLLSCKHRPQFPSFQSLP